MPPAQPQYTDCHPSRPSFASQLATLCALLPAYQGVPLESLRPRRVLFGGAPPGREREAQACPPHKHRPARAAPRARSWGGSAMPPPALHRTWQSAHPPCLLHLPLTPATLGLQASSCCRLLCRASSLLTVRATTHCTLSPPGFPCYRDAPLAPAWDRVLQVGGGAGSAGGCRLGHGRVDGQQSGACLRRWKPCLRMAPNGHPKRQTSIIVPQVGDAGGGQSPLSFGGFGSMVGAGCGGEGGRVRAA